MAIFLEIPCGNQESDMGLKILVINNANFYSVWILESTVCFHMKQAANLPKLKSISNKCSSKNYWHLVIYKYAKLAIHSHSCWVVWPQ